MTTSVRGAAVALALWGASACSPAEDVRVQPLPPKQRPSAEARAGLPEVRGTWRFAGWEISPADTGRVAADPTLLAPPGEFYLSTQRMDSLAGGYGRGAPTYPLVGEVRRDGVVSLIAYEAADLPRYAAGRVVRDTLWLEMTSFPSAATWPNGARAALVRTAVRTPFLRLLGGRPRVNYDSIRADSVRRDSLARLVQDSFSAAYPRGAATPAAPSPGAAQQPARPATGQPQPQVPRPQPTQPRPTPTRPTPQEPTLPRPLPPPTSQPIPTPVEPRDTPRRPPPVEPRPVPTQPVQPPVQMPPPQLPPPVMAPRETIRISP